MLKCRLCAEKDARISDLKSEILRLESLVFPKAPSHKMLPVIDLDNHTPPAALSQEEIDEAIEQEANMILNGTY